MEWHSSHSLPSLSGLAEGVGDQKTNSSNSPDNKTIDGNTPPADVVFPPRSFDRNSFSSSSSTSTSDDDSTHETLAGTTSSLNNDSDCENLGMEGSNCVNCRNASSAVPSLCSSACASVSSTGGSLKEVPPHIDATKLLIEELQQLSTADRCKVQEEIHGVSSCAVSEDDKKILEGLKCLENEIRAIRREVFLSPDHVSSSGNSYDEAIWAYLAVDEESSSSPTMSTNAHKRLMYSYIFHQDFRLKFLRADLYDAKKAAHRYLRCIECLLRYYGNYALQRPLTYEDLGKECQDAAKTGFFQILPSRDRAGRLVVVCQPVSKDASMSTVVKFFTYMFQVVSEDVETQKRGAIFVFSANEQALRMLSESKKEYDLYREGSMVRRSCTHFCLPENNPKMIVLRSLVMLAMPRDERLRTRIHMDGLTMETQYKLMTFGIPVTDFPITSTGGIKTKHHTQWTKTRKAIDASRMKSLEECYNKKMQLQHDQEQQGATSSQYCIDYYSYPPTYEEFLQHHGKEPIIYPMINDVLFSKGGKNVSHYGNIEFTDLMKRSLLKYVSGTETIRGTPVQNRKRRKEIRQKIVDEVQARGGRFLTLDKKLPGGYCWAEIEEGPDLHDRIATSLYDHKRRLASKLKVKTVRSGTAMFTVIDNSKRRKVITDDGQTISDNCICRR
eukprot:CAMPEP_0116126620 /NCGR_PEP_ID=MMETSP0329-20121206/6425_1 /TAXON_ID=697910 /ORGANISM="Pseudo-nitzschia arenysensis, Strain B593" /LENGTH=669 /DNA_ID=CAMNT_0003620707 /DNA_START=29 /DNA_END=2038 /DNA_ORIENTATION=+